MQYFNTHRFGTLVTAPRLSDKNPGHLANPRLCRELLPTRRLIGMFPGRAGVQFDVGIYQGCQGHNGRHSRSREGNEIGSLRDTVLVPNQHWHVKLGRGSVPYLLFGGP